MTKIQKEIDMLKKDDKISSWRKSVFERDQYFCNICLLKGKKLNAHHMNGYNWSIDERYDVMNGITLCEDCHLAFHEEYGYGQNTSDQYVEFRKNNSIQLSLF